VRFGVAPRGFFQQKLNFFYENVSLFVHFSISFLVFLLLRQFCKHRKGHQKARVLPKKSQNIRNLREKNKKNIFLWNFHVENEHPSKTAPFVCFS
jgi:hypothetical protein